MFFRIASLMAALVLVTACESTPDSASGTVKGSGTMAGGAGGPGVAGHVLKNPNAKPGSVEDFVDNIGDRVYFAFDSAELTPEDQATLDRQAEWLGKYSAVTITLEGHCDERGTREYNLALGQKRANAAKQYLVAAGVPSGRIETISYGKERPAVPGHNEEAWAMNRRAVSVVK